MRRMVAIIGVVVLAAACSDDNAAAPTSTTVTTGAAPSSTSAPEPTDAELENALVAAWERYWTTTDEVFASPSADGARLAAVATGVSLATVTASLDEFVALGRHVERPPGSISERRTLEVRWEGEGIVAAEDVTEAVVEACHIDDSVVVGPDGDVVDDDVVSVHWEVVLVLEDGDWKVSEANVLEQDEGVAGCADDF